MLADWAAIAIDHARLFRRSTSSAPRSSSARSRGSRRPRRSRGRSARRPTSSRVLELVVKRGRALVRARIVVLLLEEGDRLVVADGAGQVDEEARRARCRSHGSVAGEVLRERPARADRRRGGTLRGRRRGARRARRRDRPARPAALARALARRALRVRPDRRGAGVRRPRGGAPAAVRRRARRRRSPPRGRSRPSGCATASAPPSRSARAGHASCTTRRCRGSPRSRCCCRRACRSAATRSSRRRGRRPTRSRPRSPTCAR